MYSKQAASKMPLLVSRTVSWNYECRGCSSEYRKNLDRNRTIAIAYASCCKSLLFHWGLDLAERLRSGKNMGSSCFCAFPDHEMQELSQQANICWRLQWTSIKPEGPSSRLCWTISPALGSAPGGDGALQADVTESSSCSPNSVFMLKILASNRRTAAMKWTLFWTLTYLTYPGMWVSGDTMGEKKKPKATVQSRWTVANTYPSAYVAMVHTLRNTAHKHNQALTTLAALLPACLSVFLYLIIHC